MSMMVTDNTIEVLTMLERKTSAMEKRVEKIEMRMAELTKRKKVEGVEERGVVQGVTRHKAVRCTIGRALVMLVLLGLAISITTSEVKLSENFGNNSQAVIGSRRGSRRRNQNHSDDLTSAYVGIQAFLEVGDSFKYD
jgi:hypothetical protein